MSPIEEIQEQANAVVIDFLLIDSQAALTFLSRAEDDSAREADRGRRFQAASDAYNTIVELLPRTTLTRGQYEFLMKRLTVLRERLNRHFGDLPDVPEGSIEVAGVRATANDAVLTCWKDIANYLGRGVRTVQRWEQIYGLPVRRPKGAAAKSAVIARVADLKAWLESDWSKRNWQGRRDVKPVSAQDPSVDDGVRTTAQLRNHHRELVFDTLEFLQALAAGCAQLRSTRIAAAATRQQRRRM
ncbi:hypothetical protein [Alloacidobacterium sp.]|uniref:hypothetical protein n=1 Tax=Alloacidobacterium sp. TaxID=2951999 RepID=UPI002D6BAB7E|nr:hypothetical protein [Alloacidobacterium sp.]HYK35879.1 hypothetical protein [Alloacidobacterium sp.]